MKKLFKYIAVLAASVLAFGCYPEVLTPDQSKLPSASDFDVEIVVDQTTNYVTFTMKNQGVVPMWIFGDQKIDKSANTRYAYTANGVSLRFRDAGTHEVEVKAYNAHGISQGSQIYTFNIENTYRDPFDPTPYMRAVAGEWMWNSEVAGHFGCGEPGTDGTNWWSCGANEKADWSLYDDLMTFTAEGEYTYDPGDGQVYVNKDSGFKNEYNTNDGNDYLAPIEAYTTTYTIENDWNAAGIEDIYLVLPAGSNLSYIPNPEALTNPRWRFLETKTSAIKKKMSLVIDNGGISWKYEFIPAVKVATPEELLTGTTAEGKVWVMDPEAVGHLGCGESVENPGGWWSAQPFDKKDFGMYDDEITFYPDGKYSYSSGADGKMYINWGVTAIGPNPGAEPDIDIEWPFTESTYVFDGETITLAANTPMVYVPSDHVWNNPVFHVAEITETTLRVVADNPGCYWQMIFKARDIKGPAGPTINGTELPAELSVSQGDLLEVGNLNLAETWVDPDFFEVSGTALKFKAVAGDYQFSYDKNSNWIKAVPMVDGARATYENGKALWIIGDGGGKPTDANVVGWNTGEAPLPMAQIGENTYQITLAMKGDGSVKIFGQSDWGIEWTSDKYSSFNGNGFFKLGDGVDGDNGNIYHDGSPAGYYVFTVVDNGGIFDMTVDKKKETIFDPADAAHNMWLSMNLLSMSYYYAPGWAQIADPAVEADGNNYVISLPEATTDQWQAQVAFHTDMTSSADKTYDFCCKLVSNQDHPGVTIKLVLSGGGDNDNIFYFADRHKLTADTEYVYKMADMPGIDMDKISLFFDFGGCAAGTEVTLSDVLFQEHRAE